MPEKEVAEVEGVVLRGFGASWVGPWKLLEKSLLELQSEGYDIRLIDVDDNPGMLKEWRVVSLPTFVLTEQSREVRRFLGAVSKSDLKTALDARTKRQVKSVKKRPTRK